jgi:hypothetical protein
MAIEPRAQLPRGNRLDALAQRLTVTRVSVGEVKVQRHVVTGVLDTDVVAGREVGINVIALAPTDVGDAKGADRIVPRGDVGQ